MSKHIRIGVLVSGQGRGSNLQAILDSCDAGRITGEVVAVVSTSIGTPALDRARVRGIPALEIPAKEMSPEELDERLTAVMIEHRADVICLCGFLRKLGPKFLEQYRGRILNIHPALIPLFCGKGMYGHHVHEAVWESGVKFSGATVHFVEEEYDTGPIILQSVVPVLDDDTPDDIAARVLKEEHKIYSQAIQLFAEGRLKVEGRRVRVLPAKE